ncbi:hypothetical protein HPB47_026987 [Ixodes persulcatus]|uniref:Uncharacterized protein n=1 Tax=Ixodes persulcatus TaxID=34615 RepID=A0AC60PYK4_IXOPE|nr:hypothetical protein HPB47_026987 [Ixodes persulcatus]
MLRSARLEPGAPSTKCALAEVDGLIDKGPPEPPGRRMSVRAVPMWALSGAGATRRRGRAASDSAAEAEAACVGHWANAPRRAARSQGGALTPPGHALEPRPRCHCACAGARALGWRASVLPPGQDRSPGREGEAECADRRRGPRRGSAGGFKLRPPGPDHLRHTGACFLGKVAEAAYSKPIVGTNDLAKDGAQASLERLREVLGHIRSARPEIKRIYLSLVLPRSVNRRLRFSNHRFVRWFNGQVSTFNIEASKLCRRASGTFFIRHAFSEMPARRVLAADGLHPSFEGVALLALHLQNIIMQNKEQGPTGWSDTPRATRTPESAGSRRPASPNTERGGTQPTNTTSQDSQPPATGSQRRSTPPAEARSPYLLRGTFCTFSDAVRSRPAQQK